MSHIDENDHDRKAPEIVASELEIGTGRTGLDGNKWIVKEDENGRHYWALKRKIGYRNMSRTTATKASKSKSKSKSKTKSKTKSRSNTKRRVANKTKANSKTKSKTKSKGGTKTKSKTKSKSKRKAPQKSATIYKAGTRRKGLDGNMWKVVLDKRGVRRWQKYKELS